MSVIITVVLGEPMSYLPTFHITSEMLTYVAEIAELASAFDSTPEFIPSPTIGRFIIQRGLKVTR